VAISLIVDYIQTTLNKRGFGKNIWETRCVETVPPNVHVETNSKIQKMLSILRDRKTKLGDFSMISDQIVHLLLEKAFKYLPWSDTNGETPVRLPKNEVNEFFFGF
jgi:hypothetical protein